MVVNISLSIIPWDLTVGYVTIALLERRYASRLILTYDNGPGMFSLSQQRRRRSRECSQLRGRTLTDDRNRLSSDMVSILVCIKMWWDRGLAVIYDLHFGGEEAN